MKKVKSPNGPNIDGMGQLQGMLASIIGSRMYSDGLFVTTFEKRVADLLQVKHCVATCNGTMALMVALRACVHDNEDNQIMVPSWTFPATVQAITWMGHKAVYVDADAKLEDGEETGVGVDVRLWGNYYPVCGFDSCVVVDSAHAFGSKLPDGTPVGCCCDAEIFSFHANKIISTFEGGCITTNNGEVADAARRIIHFGMGDIPVDTIDDPIRARVGTNGKMPEVCAAMGLVMLDRLDYLIGENRRSFELYRDNLDHLPHGSIPIKLLDHDEGSNCQYIVIEMAEDAATKRNDVMLALRSEGIDSKRYFWPGCHKLNIAGAVQRGPLPETERLAARTLVLPHVTSKLEVVRISETIKRALT